MDEQPFADDLREFLRLLTKQKAPIGDRHLSPPEGCSREESPTRRAAYGSRFSISNLN